MTIGVRGIKSTDREYRESLEHGNLVFSMERVHEMGVSSIVQEIGALGNYLLSLDIDGLDPSIAPGTESPEGDGLSFHQAKQLLRGIAKQEQLVGVDVVEVNPYLSHAELTQHISVQLLRDRVRLSKHEQSESPVSRKPSRRRVGEFVYCTTYSRKYSSFSSA